MNGGGKGLLQTISATTDVTIPTLPWNHLQAKHRAVSVDVDEDEVEVKEM